MENFRTRILGIADSALDTMQGYLGGSEAFDDDRVRMAASMIREGVKVSNRDQVDAQVRRSQALKLVSYIPENQRAEYIALSNPEAKPFLLGKPKK
jgi:hypothetical protein